MKTIWITLMASLLLCTSLPAQQTDLRKTVVRFRTAGSLTAHVRQTRHLMALTDDIVTEGTLFYRCPDSVSMLFEASGEMLIATGNRYTMVREGKQRVAKTNGKGNNPFEMVRDVMSHLAADSVSARLTEMADVELQPQGNSCSLTITPIATEGKGRQRSMFTRCIVVVDLPTAELRSLHIDEPGGNYTRYDFSRYHFGAEVDDSCFDPQQVLGMSSQKRVN